MSRFKSLLGKLAFQVALSPTGSVIVGQTFARAAPLLPIKKRLMTPLAIAFDHPSPAWDTHYLIVPRKAVRTIFTLLEHANQEALEDVIGAASQLLTISDLEPPNYSLIVNGGLRQDVRQVHFHLNDDSSTVPFDMAGGPAVLATAAYTVFQLAEESGLHLVIMPKEAQPPLSQWASVPSYVIQHPLPLTELEERFKLTARGFSIIIQESSQLEQSKLVFHVTAGELQ